MSSSKHSIILTFIIVIVSLVITYLVSLNVAYKLFDMPWLSNSFLLAVWGGIFASAFVVLLCEILKYMFSKRSTEDMLYSRAIFLYSQILVLQNYVNQCLENPQVQVVKGVLNQCKNNVIFVNQDIVSCDYNTFFPKQKLFIGLKNFKNKWSQINAILSECNYFDIAINICEINNRMMGKGSTVVLGGDKLVQETAKILFSKFNELKKICDELLTAIDYSGRYQWEKNKQNVSLDDVASIKADSLEEYLRKHSNNETNL